MYSDTSSAAEWEREYREGVHNLGRRTSQWTTLSQQYPSPTSGLLFETTNPGQSDRREQADEIGRCSLSMISKLSLQSLVQLPMIPSGVDLNAVDADILGLAIDALSRGQDFQKEISEDGRKDVQMPSQPRVTI